LRLVLDTNTALSGLIWGGFPGRLIDAAVSGQVQLISSVPLLSELGGVLGRPKFLQSVLKQGFSVSDLFDGYSALVECVLPAELEGPISRDPDDDQVLAAAIGGRADLIVSGDDDLLSLVEVLGIPIVSARDAVHRLEAA
jgi:putative PIN family toxin of toxin-antitoxin system